VRQTWRFPWIHLGILFVGLLILPVSTPGSRDLAGMLTECSQIEDASERLDCYDNIARGLQEARSARGKWGVNEQTSQLDDSKTITLYLAAANVTPPPKEPVFLFLRCRDGKTTAYITWNRELANGELMMRLGKDDPERQYWNLSSDSEASFFPAETVEFIKVLMSNRLLTAQMNPRDGLPMTAVFELDGLDTAVLPLREACGW
jgi:type VI secretion system protein VasI